MERLRIKGAFVRGHSDWMDKHSPWPQAHSSPIKRPFVQFTLQHHARAHLAVTSTGSTSRCVYSLGLTIEMALIGPLFYDLLLFSI